MMRVVCTVFVFLSLFCIDLSYGNDIDDVLLVNSPKNNSQLHYIKNDTNETSSILLFTQNISLPELPSNTDYRYFLCFQLWRQNDTDSKLTNETELKCYKSIPNYPFNISNLTDGIYHIKTSLLLASQSNVNNVKLLKKELIMFHVHEMIAFHANYQWNKIEEYHSIINGLDVKMDIGGNDGKNSTQNKTNSKLVRIPSQWVLQLFISPKYRLLWLLVSKSTKLSSIKYQISKHTGIDYGCIDIMDNNGNIINEKYETVESIDWFYNKYSIFIGLEPSLFCEPIECGFGYLDREKLGNDGNMSNICDYRTIEYKQFYQENKGKMWVDLTVTTDSFLTLPPNT